MDNTVTLITALGTDSTLILELADFFNGEARYRYSPEGEEIRKTFHDRAISNLYLVCTQGVADTLAKLKSELERDYPEITLHTVMLDCEDIACKGEDEQMRQTVYETVRSLANEDLVISSAGRKQVTQRLIEAGLLYGCMGYLSITAPQDITRDPDVRKQSHLFNVLWTPVRQFSEERRRLLIKDELGDNFRSLYLLPANIVKRLQDERLGRHSADRKEELEWLRRLPKADLHCHLGGSFDAGLLKAMASQLLEDNALTVRRRRNIVKVLEEKLQTVLPSLTAAHLLALGKEDSGQPLIHPLQALFGLFDGLGEPAHILSAMLTASLCEEQLNELCWYEPEELALQDRLSWYMACGDLGGSGLLQSENTLRLALRWLMEEAWKEHVMVLEARFSPENYTRAGLSIEQVVKTLLDEAENFMQNHAGFRVNFLIMATRHKQQAAMEAHVAAAILFGKPGDGQGARITGFDLAGQEEGHDPVQFQNTLMPLHHHFMNITIHAGEMEEDDKIWQAIYLLHARRIGHGLKLINNARMMEYVRDHNIGIEMCPSSNMQTNGYCYADWTENGGNGYPLKQYLEKGLQVSINTDNRGISRTTLSKEYLKAARLSRDGLTKWELLRLAKNSFKTAFLPKNEKDEVLKEMDQQVFKLVLDDYLPGGGDNG